MRLFYGEYFKGVKYYTKGEMLISFLLGMGTFLAITSIDALIYIIK